MRSGSRLKTFRQFEPSALGCRSEASASVGKTSIASTIATIFRYDAESTKRSSDGWCGKTKLSALSCRPQSPAANSPFCKSARPREGFLCGIAIEPSAVSSGTKRSATAASPLALSSFADLLPAALCQLRKIAAQAAPLFPAYACVLIELQWHAARWSPGVLRLVLAGDRLARVPDKVIADLKGHERDGLVELPPPPSFQRGDPVRIVRGVFTGQLALFEGQRPHERVAVLLQLLGRVELAKRDIVAI
jgi:transcription antitermination factor NusG